MDKVVDGEGDGTMEEVEDISGTDMDIAVKWKNIVNFYMYTKCRAYHKSVPHHDHVNKTFDCGGPAYTVLVSPPLLCSDLQQRTPILNCCHY